MAEHFHYERSTILAMLPKYSATLQTKADEAKTGTVPVSGLDLKILSDMLHGAYELLIMATDHNAETPLLESKPVMGSGVESCEFCVSAEQPIEAQDMGEGRTMRLCPACRKRIAYGEALCKHYHPSQDI